jgi:hypothetical protein
MKRAVCVWHRRAGKDSCAINYTAKEAHRRIGVYWHVLPTQKQARKVIWQGIDKQGRRIIDQAFPKELVKRSRDDEMMVEFKNGAIWQLVGGDNYDANVGSNPVGVVFSEWSITDPRAWEYVRPILAENGGWAWFIFTPRGKNHAFEMFEMAKSNPDWHTSLLTVDDTRAISREALQAELDAGMPLEKFRQEFYCDFEVANHGAVYGREMEQLEKQGRITRVPYDARYPVETAWDIGVRDSTAIWFIQRVGKEIRFIDFHVDRNKKLPEYLSLIHSKGYSYSRHIGPHDLAREWFGGSETMLDIARNHGVIFTIAPKLSVEDGIEATRTMLSRAWFDAEKCAYGIKAAKHYHREWDEENKILSKQPVHDWSSHPCDALRYFAVTPEGVGTIPDWARDDLMPWQNLSMGAASGGYDPLSAFR